MANLVVRNIDEAIVKALKERAEQQYLTINAGNQNTHV
jgi:plasmid stability protein